MFCNNYKWDIAFKNCESLYCTPVMYIIWYINYALIKKNLNSKKKKCSIWECVE